MHTEKEIDTMGLPYDLGRLKLTQMFYFSPKMKWIFNFFIMHLLSLKHKIWFCSIMHYGPKEFSPNGKPTIKAFKGGSFGQRKGFSDLDLQKLNKYYECDKKEGFTYYLL